MVLRRKVIVCQGIEIRQETDDELRARHKEHLGEWSQLTQLGDWARTRIAITGLLNIKVALAIDDEDQSVRFYCPHLGYTKNRIGQLTQCLGSESAAPCQYEWVIPPHNRRRSITRGYFGTLKGVSTVKCLIVEGLTDLLK